MKLLQSILISGACFLLSGCMAQEPTTKEMTHEFIADFPNISKTEIYDRVVGWMSIDPKPAVLMDEYHNKIAGSLICSGDVHIKPEGPSVTMRLGFTMSIDVKDERMRIRFTQLRRLYGSKLYDEVLTDDFFKTSTAAPYQRAAQARFVILVRSLNYFIAQTTTDVATR